MENNKYIRIVKETYKDDSKEKLTIQEYDTEAEGIKAYHRRLIEAIDNENVQTAMCALIRDDGIMLKSENWEVPVEEEPEVVEEPVEESTQK